MGGNLRFSVYAVMCVARPRPLEAQLVYWPEEADKLPRGLCGDPPSLDEPLPPGPWVTVDGVFTLFWGVNTAWASSDSHVAPGLALGSKFWPLIPENTSINLVWRFSDATHSGSTHVA